MTIATAGAGDEATPAPIRPAAVERKQSGPSAPSPVGYGEAATAANSIDVVDGIVLVDFDGQDDPLRPGNLPLWRRVAMSVLILWGTFVVETDGTLYSTAHLAIAREFHITEATLSNTYWPITSWALGAATFSLLGLPLIEDLGIYYIYLGTWITLIIFIIPEAFAQNFATLIIARFFVGGCVSVIANSGATALVGLWDNVKIRSHLIGVWIVAYVSGASMGPVLGAAIFKYLSWRWTFKMQLIYYSIMFPLYVLILTEVREPAILAAKARRMRKEGIKAYTAEQLAPMSVLQILWNSLSRPLIMLAREPVLFACFVWIAFLMGNVYNFTQSVEQVFSTLYGWKVVSANLVQVAVVIGEVLGLSGVALNNYLYFRSAGRRGGDGKPLPEARLYTAIPGSLIGLVGGMMIYAWTSYSDVPWIAPAIALAIVGWGSSLVVNSVCDYLVDAYQSVAGSAMSALVLGEMLMIAFLPLSAQPMYTNLGFQWASTLLALISLVFASAPLVIIRYGREIRARSRYMTASEPPELIEMRPTVPTKQDELIVSGI